MSTSVRNLSLAIAAAMFVHLLVLAQRLTVHAPLFSVEETPITVSIQTEDASEQPIDDVESESDTEQKQDAEEIVEQALSPKEPKVKTVDLIIATKPSASLQEKIVIQALPHGNQFKRFLNSEGERYVSENPDSVSEFDKTFNAKSRYESPEELAPSHPESIPRGRTDFAQESNGRRTCLLKVLNLIDIHASSNYVSKPCTPKKKFELKLNQPNNG